MVCKSYEEFDFRDFDQGDYILYNIVKRKILLKLYPNESTNQGKELRLQQQYFFASCFCKILFEDLNQIFNKITNFSQRKYQSNLMIHNSAIGIAELMRIFVDEKEIPWKSLGI